MQEYEILYFSLRDTQQKAAWYPPAPSPCLSPHAHISACSAASHMTTEASVSSILHWQPVSFQQTCDFATERKNRQPLYSTRRCCATAENCQDITLNSSTDDDAVRSPDAQLTDCSETSECAPKENLKADNQIAAVKRLRAKVCSGWAHLVAVVDLEMRWGCGQEQAEGRDQQQRAAKEAGTSEKTNRHNCIGAVDAADGIHMIHIHGLRRQQKEASTLWEWCRWVSMADRWAISESLFSPLTAKADYAGSTAVYSVAQNKWKWFHQS